MLAWFSNIIVQKGHQMNIRGLAGGSVVKNVRANAADTG